MDKLYNVAIDAVAATMKAKMVQAEEIGKEGWDDKDLCDAAFLSQLFFTALKKQNIISAMNYLMMLWFRNEKVRSTSKLLSGRVRSPRKS